MVQHATCTHPCAKICNTFSFPCTLVRPMVRHVHKGVTRQKSISSLGNMLRPFSWSGLAPWLKVRGKGCDTKSTTPFDGNMDSGCMGTDFPGRTSRQPLRLPISPTAWGLLSCWTRNFLDGLDTDLDIDSDSAFGSESDGPVSKSSCNPLSPSQAGLRVHRGVPVMGQVLQVQG